ncbi:ATP-dependent DNA helicase [Frankliniella fusca]|uniref:ATP-dependent DNA helicase n=1 Tax=Frankliniella fusca TaxID=407009 RepID=A0AAE1GVV2_9NEOP|nr:ATP-dependent DNA helicase [Frankliniella fusca]
MGDGTANEVGCTKLNLPGDIVRSGIHHLIDHCFGKEIDKEDADEAAILCPTNSATYFVNELILQRLKRNVEETRVYFSSTFLEKRREMGEEANNAERLHYPPEYLGALQSASLPPHRLELVPGANVMLIRNLRVSGGLCNSTRLRVKKLYANLIVCEILTGSHKEQTVSIFRISFSTDEFSLPGRLKRRHFPPKLCYAMIVNKSQGQTLKRVGLYLRTALWTHGQTYVAFSRVRSQDAVKAVVEEGPDKGRVNNNRGAALAGDNVFTQNPVYIEILRAVGLAPTNVQEEEEMDTDDT